MDPQLATCTIPAPGSSSPPYNYAYEAHSEMVEASPCARVEQRSTRRYSLQSDENTVRQMASHYVERHEESSSRSPMVLCSSPTSPAPSSVLPPLPGNVSPKSPKKGSSTATSKYKSTRQESFSSVVEQKTFTSRVVEGGSARSSVRRDSGHKMSTEELATISPISTAGGRISPSAGMDVLAVPTGAVAVRSTREAFEDSIVSTEQKVVRKVHRSSRKNSSSSVKSATVTKIQQQFQQSAASHVTSQCVSGDQQSLLRQKLLQEQQNTLQVADGREYTGLQADGSSVRYSVTEADSDSTSLDDFCERSHVSRMSQAAAFSAEQAEEVFVERREHHHHSSSYQREECRQNAASGASFSSSQTSDSSGEQIVVGTDGMEYSESMPKKTKKKRVITKTTTTTTTTTTAAQQQQMAGVNLASTTTVTSAMTAEEQMEMIGGGINSVSTQKQQQITDASVDASPQQATQQVVGVNTVSATTVSSTTSTDNRQQHNSVQSQVEHQLIDASTERKAQQSTMVTTATSTEKQEHKVVSTSQKQQQSAAVETNVQELQQLVGVNTASASSVTTATSTDKQQHKLIDTESSSSKKRREKIVDIDSAATQVKETERQQYDQLASLSADMSDNIGVEVCEAASAKKIELAEAGCQKDIYWEPGVDFGFQVRSGKVRLRPKKERDSGIDAALQCSHPAYGGSEPGVDYGMQVVNPKFDEEWRRREEKEMRRRERAEIRAARELRRQERSASGMRSANAANSTDIGIADCGTNAARVSEPGVDMGLQFSPSEKRREPQPLDPGVDYGLQFDGKVDKVTKPAPFETEDYGFQIDNPRYRTQNRPETPKNRSDSRDDREEKRQRERQRHRDREREEKDREREREMERERQREGKRERETRGRLLREELKEKPRGSGYREVSVSSTSSASSY